jgi:hypothetical protein
MADGSGEIIIKGGSVHVQFNGTIYKNDPGDPDRHSNPNRKITRIVVHDENDTATFDSGDSQGGLKWTVTVYTK